MKSDLCRLLEANGRLVIFLQKKLQSAAALPAPKELHQFAQVVIARVAVVESVLFPQFASDWRVGPVVTSSVRVNSEIRASLAMLLTVRSQEDFRRALSELSRSLEAVESTLANDFMPLVEELSPQDSLALAVEADAVLEKHLGADCATFLQLEQRKGMRALLEEARTVLSSLSAKH